MLRRRLLLAIVLLGLGAAPAWAGSTAVGNMPAASSVSGADIVPTCQVAQQPCASPSSPLHGATLGQVSGIATPGAAGVNAAAAMASVYQVASPTGTGTTCSLASPCSITQAQTNAQGQSVGNRTIYLRAGTYSLSPAGSDPCSLGASGPAAINLTSSDAGEVWATWPGDALDGAVLDGGATSNAGIVGSISGTTLTETTLYTGPIAAGQFVYGSGVTASTEITGGSGTSWTVNNSQTVGSETLGLSNGTKNAFCVAMGHGNNAPPTFYGLTIQNFAHAGIYTGGSPIIVQDSIFSNDGTYGFSNGDSGAINGFEPYNSQITHNYVHDIADFGIVMTTTAVNTMSGLVIANNVLLNTCNMTGSDGDCGAIGTNGVDNTGTDSPGPQEIVNNYIRDVYATEGNGFANNLGYCIYHDSYSMDVIDAGNICAGKFGAAVMVHASTNIHYVGNIISLNGGGSSGSSGAAPMRVQEFNSDPMTGDVFEGNIVVGNYNGAAGAGWYTDASGIPALPTTQDNLYYNFNPAGTVANSCSGQCGTGSALDQYPLFGNPMMRCYGAVLAPTSPSHGYPISFAVQPVTWDQPGFWGPVGFTIPQTGNAPLWPTTSGDGLICTSTN